MPLAPLSPSNTPRYWVDYEANGVQHTMQFRYPGGALSGPPDTGFLNGITLFLSELLTLLPSDFTIVGARYAPAGSDVTLPTTAPSSPGTGGGTPAAAEVPAYLTFVGRTSAGRKVKVQVYGVSASPASEGGVFSDYRLTAGQSTPVDDAIAALGILGAVGIDGESINWYTYANCGYGAYWQKKQRGAT